MPVTRLDPAPFDWASGAGGAAGVRRVADQALEHDGRDALNEAARLELRHHGLEGGAGYWDDAGGFAFVHGLFGVGRPELELVVAPEARGRGAGARLLTAVLEMLDGIPVTAWSHGDHPAARRLARRFDFDAVRELWLMRRPLTSLPAGDPPPDVVVRAFRVGADEESFLRANAAAFAGHPEQGSLDRRGLAERLAEPWFDPSGFLLAWSDDELLGFHWTKTHEGPAPYGEVYVLGVSPAAQGRGLGRVLLDAGLAHLRSSGLGEVVLYVEAGNAAAVKLYDRRGFTHAATDVMYASRL